MLAARIAAFLNAGDTVVAEVPADAKATRRFVRIRPQPKPGIPREERRYLNSSWSMWEYWDFEIRCLTLRDGWQDDEWNYDRYITEDQRVTTVDQPAFERALCQWVHEVGAFKHVNESPLPE
jgi:hypothetical protein